jgi:regulator of RNase E activity RraA
MRTGKDRVEVADTQVPIALGDVQVRPGDIVLGDDDGVVVVPRHRLAQVSDLAAEIAEREDAITAAVLSGATIGDARKRFGYHTLQREGS